MKCIHCGKEIRDNAKFCPLCGKKIESNMPKVPLADKINEPSEVIYKSHLNEKPGKVEETIVIETKICSHCKKEIKSDMKFCPYCGEKIDYENVANNEISDKENTSKCIDTSKANIQKENSNPNEAEGLKASEYFFGQKWPYRELIAKTLKIVDKGIVAIFSILILLFIYEEYNLDVTYKFSIYIIRFLVAFSLWFVIYAAFSVAKDFLILKRNQIQTEKNAYIYITLQVVAFFVYLKALGVFISVSNLTAVKWYGVIAFGNTSDVVSTFSTNIFCFILYIIIKSVADHLIINTENAE